MSWRQRRQWRRAQRSDDCTHPNIRGAYAAEMDDLGIDAFLRCEDCGIGFDWYSKPIDPKAPKVVLP